METTTYKRGGDFKTDQPAGINCRGSTRRGHRAQYSRSVHSSGDTIRSMREEEFDRRAAEMKTRMLAQRHEPLEEPSTTPVRKSRAKRGQEDSRITSQSSDAEDIQAMRKRVKELETENRRLREQLAGDGEPGDSFITVLGGFCSRAAAHVFQIQQRPAILNICRSAHPDLGS